MIKFLFDRDTWQELYDSIRKNKLRTLVTIFGVGFGIFLLIVLLGSARGMENSFNSYSAISQQIPCLFGDKVLANLLKDFKKAEGYA
ncbi:ABC transporter permease [Jejuia pallidilutea]|uniref:ABC transporter permease n=1 Tax=Jejuia pallidilutea TaxID=504487 RepID=UPI0034E1AD43